MSAEQNHHVRKNVMTNNRFHLHVVLFLVLGRGFLLEGRVEKASLATHGCRREGGVVKVEVLHP